MNESNFVQWLQRRAAGLILLQGSDNLFLYKIWKARAKGGLVNKWNNVTTTGKSGGAVQEVAMAAKEYTSRNGKSGPEQASEG